jgi:hypothetical protein
MKIMVKKMSVALKTAQVKQSKVAAVVAAVVKKARGVTSLFYQQVRSTPLHPLACACRKADYNGQVYGPAITGAVPAVVSVTGVQGVSMVEARMKGNLMDLGDKSFDVTQFKKVKVMSPTAAIKWAASVGKLQTVSKEEPCKRGTKTVWEPRKWTGYVVGDFAQMNVGFIERTGKTVRCLNTRAIKDGRNRDRVFSLGK